jgi:hypothetical protein
MKARSNLKNGMVITLEWLEEEINHHEETYMVIEGFYASWDELKNEPSPNLETILNFMFSKGYECISIQPMGNPSCKEIIFKKIESSIE